MSDAAIWQLADEVLASQKPIQARADVTATDVRATGLEIEPEPTPHPEPMEIAKGLAIASTLVLRNTP